MNKMLHHEYLPVEEALNVYLAIFYAKSKQFSVSNECLDDTCEEIWQYLLQEFEVENCPESNFLRKIVYNSLFNLRSRVNIFSHDEAVRMSFNDIYNPFYVLFKNKAEE